MLTPEGLYVYKPSQEFLNSIASFKAETGEDKTGAAICYVVTSVDDNKKRFTERQFLKPSKLGTLMVWSEEWLQETSDTYWKQMLYRIVL